MNLQFNYQTLRKFTAITAAAAAFLSVCGCTPVQQNSPFLDQQASEFIGTTTSETTIPTTTTTTTITTTELTGPEFSEIPLEIPYVDICETELIYQAEDIELTAAFETDNTKTDYTGSGYIKGLTGTLQNTFAFKAEIPASQHYDITIVICADNGAECTLLLNDEEITDIAAEANENFVSVTVPGIFMDAGENTISICQKDGEMFLDCMELRNNTSLVPNRDIQAVSCDPEASPEVLRLLSFLCDSYGGRIISGQHVSGSADIEIEHIVKTAGKYPAIRFDDMYPYSSNGGEPEFAGITDSCINWSERGGIVGLMWHWYAPSGEPKTLAMSESFSLSAMTGYQELALLSQEKLGEMAENGEISSECLALIKDIDTVSAELKKLCDADIPVLWRPLHQAGSGLYWWESEGSDAYRWLWNLLFTRMTEYHSLHNLIWVWNGNDTAYVPDTSKFDIASADIYLAENEETGSGYEAFYALQEIAPNKLLSLSESSSLPNLPLMFRDGSVWSYFGLWYEPYLTQEDNGFVTSEQLISFYNSEGVLTREDYISYCELYDSEAETVTTATEENFGYDE
ncbi:MAG: hypothetical protein J6B17_01730 [Ruminococcus sp.]|nr:hypothetical protein [Ruminococcus sp.]